MAKAKGLKNAFYLRGKVTCLADFKNKAGKALGLRVTLLLENDSEVVLSVFQSQLDKPENILLRRGVVAYASGSINVWKPRADKEGFVQLNVTDFRVLEAAPAKAGKAAQESVASDADDNLPWED